MRRFFPPLAAAVALFPGIFSWYTASPFVCPEILHGSAQGAWSEIVNLTSNALTGWYVLPFPGATPELHWCFAALLFFVGNIILFSRVAPERGPLSALCFSLIAGASLFNLFALDTVTIDLISLLPWFMYGGMRILPAGSGMQALAVLVVILGIAPTPFFPDYPSLAHVVPDDGLPGMLRPLVGPDTPIPFIDREVVRAIYGPAAFCLLLISMVCFLIPLRKPRPALRWSIWAVLLCAAAAVDSYLPERLSQIGPLAALERVVPHLNFFALAPLALAIGIYLLLAALHAAGAGLMVLLCAFLFLVIPGTGPALEPGRLVARDSCSVLEQLAAWQKRANPTPELAKHINAVVSSPSHALIKRTGLWIVTERETIEALHEMPFAESNGRITASHRSTVKALGHASDGKPKTRWSAKQGRQHGNEWLHLSWDSALSLSGIVLNTGSFPADFPRGLRISYARECNAACLMPQSLGCAASADYKKLLDMPSWQGAIQYLPDGYPYYGAQSDVRIYFPDEIQAKCLLIEQTAQNGSFDWSVAEIALLRK